MKATTITTAALSFLLGIAGPIAFGEGQRDDRQNRSTQQQQAGPQQGGPYQQGGRQQPSVPSQQQPSPQQSTRQQSNSQPQQQPSPQQQSNQRDGRGWQGSPQSESRGYQQPQQRRDQQEQSRAYRRSGQGRAWEEHRARNWESDHRNWQQRGGYTGYRIPNNRFNGYFGPSHPFRIRGLPFSVVGGYPRFRYGGYWLTLVDPWPGQWADDWYESDDVYVAFDGGGYYLYNRRYPGVGLAIRVSF